MAHARRVVSELPPEERPGLVTAAATWVADAAPRDRQNHPRVIDYRHFLRPAATRDARA